MSIHHIIPEVRRIYLIFNFFDLEHDPDYIEIGTGTLISDRDNRLHRYSGSHKIPDFVKVKSNKVWIQFYTDKSEKRQGFNISYSADPGPPSVPRIIINNEQVMEGDRVTLTCLATGIPPPDYKWYFNGKYLDGKDNQYTIAAVSIGDSGQYSCTATNEENTTMSSIYLTSYAPKQTIHFHGKLFTSVYRYFCLLPLPSFYYAFANVDENVEVKQRPPEKKRQSLLVIVGHRPLMKNEYAAMKITIWNHRRIYIVKLVFRWKNWEKIIPALCHGIHT
ncbi:uncharacterized protein [Ptychodera flava]|uniref:uncharacterized protein n=1 Tax=Ptychodera flava TaxID=63121 RepID=UPI00396A74D0